MTSTADLQAITQSAHTDFAISRVFTSHEYNTGLELLNALQAAESISDEDWYEKKSAFNTIGRLTTMGDSCLLRLEDALTEIISFAQSLSEYLGEDVASAPSPAISIKDQFLEAFTSDHSVQIDDHFFHNFNEQVLTNDGGPDENVVEFYFHEIGDVTISNAELDEIKMEVSENNGRMFSVGGYDFIFYTTQAV